MIIPCFLFARWVSVVTLHSFALDLTQQYSVAILKGYDHCLRVALCLVVLSLSTNSVFN